MQLGERLRLARKRRKLTTGQVAERAGISRSTLYHLEMGEANSSMGTLLQVLMALRLEDDLALLGKDDVLGQKLMDAQLLRSSRPRRIGSPSGARPAPAARLPSSRASHPPQLT